MLPYLVELTQRIASGWEHQEESEREAFANFLWSQQNSDGGFRGRSATSDLYYTGFALRGLAVLGNDSQDKIQLVANYLRQESQSRASVIDLISLVFAAKLIETWSGEGVFSESQDWQQSVANLLEELRRPDGGYAKAQEGKASSTYQTFLITLTYQLLEIAQPNPELAAEFVLSQQREDGGFVEISVMQRSGTNPTAAAIGVLRSVAPDSLSSDITQQVSSFLLSNQTEEGGFRANTQIPIADLLSTYTALQTLVDLGISDEIHKKPILEYVTSLRTPEYGFIAAAWDEIADVEYSFYGVASLGLLNQLPD